MSTFTLMKCSYCSNNYALAESSGAAWLPGMKWVCSGSHDYHVTFTALETLLTLLSHDNCSKSRDGLPKTAVSVLCPDISSVARDSSFIEVWETL